ncbi:MAG: polysaccharide pyruvyl transferase family protein [Weeksellaceae bacterium]
MSQVLFNGFYGFKNTGDDAFVEIASWGNQNFWNNEKLPYVAGSDLPITLIPYKTVHSHNANKFVQKLGVFDKALHSDYFITAGGSFFSEIRPMGNIVFAQQAQRLNKKLKHGAIGVSIGPFKNGKEEKKVQEYLKSLNFLTLRDNLSYEYANSLELNCKPINAFDLAALLPICYSDINSPMKQNDKNVIGVSICNYERYHGGDLKNEEKRNKFLKQVLTALAKNEKNYFKFYIFNDNQQIGDHQITAEMTSLLPTGQFEIVPYSEVTRTTWQDIKSCDFMFSVRLHASVFACYANIPFMLIEYHRKCADFLEDVGYDTNLRVFDGIRDPNEVVRDIENILNGAYRYPINVNQTIERAKLNFNEVVL